MRFALLARDLGPIGATSRFGSKTFSIWLSGLIVLFVPVFLMTASAQQNPASMASADTARLKPGAEDTRYRIGAGDVLTIIVRKAPELSLEAVRVDQRGVIHIPMIDQDIAAACRTEGELASIITTLYKEYKNNPSVEVFVRDFQSRPVAVIGAVNAPGQFRLQRQVRLLELLSFAGGPTASAGRVINVIHTGGPVLCQKDPEEADANAAQVLGVLNLNDTLKGKEGANPFVKPGDIIQLPEADQVYVIGHVVQPKVIALKDKAITVSWAIAMAGGPARDGKTSGVRIVREAEGGGKQEIIVDLKAIQKRKAPDVVLVPNDIVEVGQSTGKTILGILQGAVPAAISQGVITAIP
jgi:polysaccharide export outer membrane protein